MAPRSNLAQLINRTDFINQLLHSSARWARSTRAPRPLPTVRSSSSTGMDDLLAAVADGPHQLPQPNQTIPVLARWSDRLLSHAEAPALFSPRDGKLLRLVLADRRLGQEQQAALLRTALRQHPSLYEAAFVAYSTAPDASRPRLQRSLRHVAALLRGWVYQTAGQPRQALLDARYALATAAAPGKRTATADADGSPTKAVAVGDCTGTVLVATNGSSEAEANLLRGVLSSSWVPAHELASDAYAALDDWSSAALHAQIVSDQGLEGAGLYSRGSAAGSRLGTMMHCTQNI